ncbi:type IV pilin protein [Steroidobacter flavus]|uniref:Type IV pilin protein n=1 Tax=Steroidobacter flavus TaxID=1842136 RepID=A0ABV8SYK1_9GAMM
MRHKQLGMSLIELMIVVAIVGILAAIAYPSYRQYVVRGNRTEAKTAIMQASQAMEKCFTRFGVYNSAQCATYNNLRAAAGVVTEGGRYRLTFAQINDVQFTIQAAPLGAQATDDRACGTLTLDQTNQRAASATTDTKKCW